MSKKLFPLLPLLPNSPPKPALYEPLNESRHEIRLLKIQPKTDSPNVHCKLQTYSLEKESRQYREFLRKCGSETEEIDGRTPTPTASVAPSQLQWVSYRLGTGLANVGSMKKINSHTPSSTLHRYKWGDFAALSYVWGDASDTRIIVVNNYPMHVTANLESVLRHLRDKNEFSGRFMLWVDALCINQKDLAERAAQIQRMRQIYGMAWTVVAWLGEGSVRSDAAVQLLHDFVALEKAGCIAMVEENLRRDKNFLGSGCWLGLHELMDRTYWKRLWIIQEVVMGAASVWIRVGGATIDWLTFCEAIAVLQEHLWLAKDQCLVMDIRTTGMDLRPVWKTISLHLVYQDLAVMSRTAHDPSPGQEPSFGRLLDLANSADCINKRDKVYALIGLMPRAVERVIRPNYTLPLSTVYVRAARTFIEVYGKLDALREGNPWGPAQCPSWAADWLWRGRSRNSRVEGPLWGPSYLFPRVPQTVRHVLPYCASGKSNAQFAFSGDGLLLGCSGFIIDRITGLSARGVGYFSWDADTVVRPDNWHSIYGSHERTSEALFRTLVADRVVEGQAASARHAAILRLPSTFARGGPQFVERGWKFMSGQEGYYFRWERFRAVNGDFPLGDSLLDHFFSDELPAEADEFLFTEVYSCFDRSSQRRRFMTTEGGYMGWAPDNIYGRSDEQTRQGDLIAIVFGCSTPVVIRPRGPHFQVLGEAFVQGLMDGEAMEGLELGKFHSQSFVLC
ncbi:HET-domain-containing protein [Massarina eburnea CBS 473.64]|uniref:HET-domain-containing protein n=1 Tax=Massarina eburnea CBS 473.64 TaxID=1395130 RepID=A0A6A6RYZ4_9PLEO|nr:HET-domain-containing protein [Massarina eburnea CBS 473.64]